MANKLYQVQAGDTLRKIALAQLGEEPRWQEIAFINSLSQPYIIYPGQLIMVPALDQPPMEVVIKEYAKPPDTDNAAAPEVDFKLSPAELGLLAGGVFLLWWVVSR